MRNPTMNLKDRIIVITGASKGIGAASARLFASLRAHLVLVARSEPALELLANSLRDAESDIQTCVADVTNPDDCARVAATAIDRFGRIDGLFNNAGQLHDGDAGILETTPEIWNLTIRANLDSVFLMSRAVVPCLVENGRGAILNNASMVAHIGSATAQIAYCAAKGGVVAMSREMAIELAPRNIRVNAISPGPVSTELFRSTIGQQSGFMDQRLPHMPMKRLGEAHEIASTAAFLLSDSSSFLTGQSIIVDGGITAAYTT